MRRKLIVDVETADPDDSLMLMLAATHPSLELVAVNVTPGTPEQVAVVRAILADLCGASDAVPIGAFDVTHTTPHGGSCVSGWHLKALAHLGLTPESRAAPDADGFQILEQFWSDDVTLVTGAPLKNLGRFLRNFPDRRPGPWVAQGGFAGANVVPRELRLPKFGDAVWQQTFNMAGDIDSAVLALAAPQLRGKTTLVSKNLCHRVMFTAARLAQIDARLERPFASEGQQRTTALIARGMRIYLDKRAGGKAFHDPLALAAAIDPTLFRWANVRCRQSAVKRAAFGCETGEETGEEEMPHQISIDCDEDAVFERLFPDVHD